MDKVLSSIGTEMLMRILDETGVGITISDPNIEDNPLIYVNKAFEVITGYEKEDVIGKNCRMLQGPESNKDTINLIRQGLEDRTNVDVIIKNYTKQGRTYWNNLHISPIFDGKKNLKYFIGISKDVTETHQKIRSQKTTILELKSLVRRLKNDSDEMP